METEINASELQRRCFEILRTLRVGEPVVILWRGTPVARLEAVDDESKAA